MLTRLQRIVTEPAVRFFLFLILVGLTLILTESFAEQIRPQIVYLAPDGNGIDQLFGLQPPDGSPRPLTQEAVGILDYAPAPDGSHIAYTALRKDGGSDLWAVSPTRPEPYPLLQCPQEACQGVAWAKARLFYERAPLPSPEADPDLPQLWWLDPERGETRPLADIHGYGARISFDGQWLSYIAADNVQIYHLEEGRHLYLPSRVGGVPVWSPIENHLLLTDVRQGETAFVAHLLRFSPDTKAMLNLTGASQTEDSSPAWSSDGQWIALMRKAAGTPMGKQLWLMRSDGSDAYSLTDQTNIHHGLPAWSPDGRYLTFQRVPLAETNLSPTLWLIDRETGRQWELASPAGQASWLPSE